MTKQQVTLSWGEPWDINKTLLRNLSHEQWVYKSGDYVYFDNGIVTAIQD